MAAVGLAVVVLLAAGITIAVAKLAGAEKEAAAGVPLLSGTWARGATQFWELTGIPESPGQPLMASDDRMVVMAAQDGHAAGRVLTGYDISGASARQIWERTITVDIDFEVPLQLWGRYLVYAGQIIDADTGDPVTAPWDERASVTATPGGPYSIACVPGGQCTGYDLNLKELWSIPFEGTDIAASVEAGGEYYSLMYWRNTSDSQAQVINLRTGETAPLRGRLDMVQSMIPLRDAWVTYREFQPTLIMLDGTVSALAPNPTTRDVQQIAITPGGGPTAADFRLKYELTEEPAKNQILGEFSWETCIFRLDGARVHLTPGGTEDGCDTPTALVAASPDGNVVAALVTPAATEAEVHYVLIEVGTGDVLWRHRLGGGVVVARSKLLVSVMDGTITGWVPR